MKSNVTRLGFFLLCFGAISASAQENQEVVRNANSPQVTYGELITRFRNQPPLPPVKISTPTSPILSSETRLSENQNPYEFIEGKVEKLVFDGKAPLDLCSHPDGSKMFAIFEDQAKVFIVDPTQLKIIGDFACPRFPVSLCCSAKNLAVACHNSAVVSYFDLATHELVAASTAYLEGKLRPISLLSQAPDKSLISVWKHPHFDELDENVIVVIGEEVTSTILGLANMDSCCFVRNSSLMIFQSMVQVPTNDKPIGIPNAIGENATGRLKLHSKPLPSNQAAHSPAFVSQNGSYFVLPRITDKARMVGDYKSETILLNSEIEKVLSVIPGLAVAEYDGAFITIGRVFRTQNRSGRAECEIRFVNCVTQKDERVIRIMDTNGAVELDRNAYRVVFVPGHEILFIRPTQKSIPWYFVRCGPLEASKSHRKEKVTTTLRTMLPSKLQVGKATDIKLDVAVEPANASVAFKLVKGPPGMKIDRKSGEIRFLPNDVNLGECQAQLVCIVNESEYPLVTWFFEVEE